MQMAPMMVPMMSQMGHQDSSFGPGSMGYGSFYAPHFGEAAPQQQPMEPVQYSWPANSAWQYFAPNFGEEAPQQQPMEAVDSSQQWSTETGGMQGWSGNVYQAMDGSMQFPYEGCKNSEEEVP